MPQQKIETQTQKKNASFADKAVLPTNNLLIVIVRARKSTNLVVVRQAEEF